MKVITVDTLPCVYHTLHMDFFYIAEWNRILGLSNCSIKENVPNCVVTQTLQHVWALSQKMSVTVALI